MNKVHTHYDNLKVARDAPPEVIRAAYKTLCHKFHPDRHGGSERAKQTFQLVNAAYEVLSDPARRRQHDAWIARTEGRPREPQPPKRSWNGQERRRRPWTAAGTPIMADLGGRLRRPGATLALWTTALAGTLLFLLYHA